MTGISKYGWNIALGARGDDNRLIPILRQSNSAYHVLFTGGTNPGKERQDVIDYMVRINHPNTQYIHRLWDKLIPWREFPAERVRDQYLKAMKPHDKIVTETICNEPQDTENKDFVENQIAILRYAQEAGHRIGLGVIGVGGPKEQHVMSGTFDNLYLAIHEANQRQPGSAYLNKHEYWNIWPESGAGFPFPGAAYQELLVPGKLSQFSRPQDHWRIREGRWLLGRSDWEAVRCQQLGIEPVPMLFTEFGWDGVGDPKENLDKWTVNARQVPEDIAVEYGINRNEDRLINFWFERLKNKYGLAKFNFDMRGVGSVRKILAAIYPGLNYEQAVVHVLKHVHDVYLWRSHIHAAVLFCCNYSGEWGGAKNTSGHNYFEELNDTALIAIGNIRLEDTTPTPVPEPVPIPIPIPEPTPLPDDDKPVMVEVRIKSNSLGGTYIRQDPAKAGTIIGLVSGKVESPSWVSERRTQMDGLTWAWIEYTDPAAPTKAYAGYVALNFILPDLISPPLINITLNAAEARLLLSIASKIKG